MEQKHIITLLLRYCKAVNFLPKPDKTKTKPGLIQGLAESGLELQTKVPREEDFLALTVLIPRFENHCFFTIRLCRFFPPERLSVALLPCDFSVPIVCYIGLSLLFLSYMRASEALILSFSTIVNIYLYYELFCRSNMLHCIIARKCFDFKFCPTFC